MSKVSASASLPAPVVRRTPGVAESRPPNPSRPSPQSAASFPEAKREDDIRWVTGLLRRVDLAPPADFAAQMRAARNQAEVENLISDQIQRAIDAVRAVAREDDDYPPKRKLTTAEKLAIVDRAHSMQTRVMPCSAPLIRQLRREWAEHVESRVGVNLKPMTEEDEREMRAVRDRAIQARRARQRK